VARFCVDRRRFARRDFLEQITNEVAASTPWARCNNSCCGRKLQAMTSDFAEVF
jgi:hypothetical protein